MNHEERNRKMEEIYRKYRMFIRSVARSTLIASNCRADSECIDETEYRVNVRLLSSALELFREECNLKTYLGKITRNCAKNYARSRSRHESDATCETDGMDKFEARHEGNWEDMLVERIRLEDALKSLRREAASLGETYPVVFRMLFEERRKQKEVARALGRSISTVAEMKERICQAGKQVLLRDFPDLVIDVIGTGTEKGGHLEQDALRAMIARGGDAWTR